MTNRIFIRSEKIIIKIVFFLLEWLIYYKSTVKDVRVGTINKKN